MLEVSNMSGGYGRADVLENISLSVTQGEAVGLLGPNGAGKSSLMAALTATLPRRAGTLRFGSRDLSRAHGGGNSGAPGSAAWHSPLSRFTRQSVKLSATPPARRAASYRSARRRVLVAGTMVATAPSAGAAARTPAVSPRLIRCHIDPQVLPSY